MSRLKSILHLLITGGIFGFVVWHFSKTYGFIGSLFGIGAIYTVCYSLIKSIFSQFGFEISEGIFYSIKMGGDGTGLPLIIAIVGIVAKAILPYIAATQIGKFLPNDNIAVPVIYCVWMYLVIVYPWICDIATIITGDEFSNEGIRKWHIRGVVAIAILTVIIQIGQCLIIPKIAEKAMYEDPVNMIKTTWESSTEEQEQMKDEVFAFLDEGEWNYVFGRYKDTCNVRNEKTYIEDGIEKQLSVNFECKWQNGNWKARKGEFEDKFLRFAEPISFSGTGKDFHTEDESNSTCTITFNTFDVSADSVEEWVIDGNFVAADTQGNIIFESAFTGKVEEVNEDHYVIVGELETPRGGLFLQYSSFDLKYYFIDHTAELYDMYNISLTRQ